MEKRLSKRLVAGLVASLPWLLPLSFLVFPMVSSAAFRAFSCESFDDGRSFLRADYSVRCNSGVHHAAMAYACVVLFLVPVGIPLGFAIVIHHYLDDIVIKEPSDGSGWLLCQWLVSSYRVEDHWLFAFGECADLWRRASLCTICVVVNYGSASKQRYLVRALFGSLLSLAAQPCTTVK